jgi:hypothetical protein
LRVPEVHSGTDQVEPESLDELASNLGRGHLF